MYIDVRDHLRNSIQVTFSLDSTFGDIRNAVNCSLPPGFVVGEYELVPAPFAHYIEDDPECFKGPSDEWYVVDVFFDEIAAGLRKCEADESVDRVMVCLRLVSISPLGLAHRVGILFPGERALDAVALEALIASEGGGVAADLLAAASEIRGYDLRSAFAGNGRDGRAARDGAIVLGLARVEMRMRRDAESELASALPSWAHAPVLPDEIAGVAGFGAAGEAAALVFCGALTLEEALELGDARARALEATAADAGAVSVMGADRRDVDRALGAVRAEGLGPIGVSHDLFDGCLVVAGAGDAVDAFKALKVDGATVRPTDAGRGAQSPLADSADYGYALGELAKTGELRYPLYCASGPPQKYQVLSEALPQLAASLSATVEWREAVSTMLADDVTHFVDAGGQTQLKAFMAQLSPPVALLMT